MRQIRFPHSAPEATGHSGPSRGSASVETVGLILLLALALTGAVGFLALSRDHPPGRGVGQRIANRIACGPRAGDTCNRHPLVPAYGWPMARAVRLLAPRVETVNGLVPVDFRYCQRSSCSVPGPRPGLTTANRRVTFFTETRSIGAGRHEIAYWLYRPSAGWESRRIIAGPAEIAAASGTRLLLRDTPRLVPLELLPGRNHYRLPTGDEPPWQWRVKSLFPGRSA